MRYLSPICLCATLVLLLTVAAGCPKSSPPATDGHVGGTDEHAHDDHGHSHDEGPSGGHVIELGDEQYHIEWLHDDEEGLLTFIVLDAAMKNEVPIDAENITIELTLENDAGEKQMQQVLIPAEERTAENPKSARFALADKAALYNITENPKVDAVLKVTIDGQEFSEKIEHDTHHGHSHSHD